MLRRMRKPQSGAVCRNVQRRKNRTAWTVLLKEKSAEEFPSVPPRRRSAALPHVAPRVAFCEAGWHPCPTGRENRLSGALWGNVRGDGSRDFGDVGDGRFWCGIKRWHHRD